MSAVILRFPAPLRANDAQLDCAAAERRITAQTRGLLPSIIATAKARAAKRIRGGQCWTLAADHAIKWAHCANHDNTTPPGAA